MHRFVFVAVSLLLSACGFSSKSDPADPPEGGSEAGTCTPAPGDTGNSLHVGAYCSPNGGQCEQYGSSFACSIDLDPRGGDFCIQIGCTSNGACGEDACCTGDPGNPVMACVPLECVADGGTCPPPP